MIVALKVASMLAARHKASLKSIFAQTYPLTQYSHNVLPRLGHQLMNHSALRYRHSDDLITRWPCQAISPIPLFPSQNRPIQTKYRPSPCLPPISSHHNSPLEKLSHILSAHETSRVRTSLEHAFRISGREGSPSSFWERERERERASACVITGRPLKATRLVSADRPPEYTPWSAGERTSRTSRVRPPSLELLEHFFLEGDWEEL